MKTLDVRFRLRGPLPLRLPIVIVSIDQDSFDELDSLWPWPRTLHADLVQMLAVQQATLIAMDLLFAEPKADPAEDHALADAIQTAGNVVLTAEYTQVPGAFGTELSLSLPIPLLRDHVRGYGPVNVIPDQDGVVRSALLGLPFQDRVYPAFAYQVYQRIIDSTKPAAHAQIFPQPQVYYINYRGPARSYPIVPHYRVLRDELEPSFFKDKIVLVGALAASLHVLYPTPFSAKQPIAAVEFQANFIETLVANDPMRPIATRSHALLFALLTALTIGCAVSFAALNG